MCAVKQTQREKGEEMYERNYEQAGRRLLGWGVTTSVWLVGYK